MPCTVVVGGFWGDEGKGKVISHITLKNKVDVGVRGGVGPNAGHTVMYRGKTFKLRMLPSTFLNPTCKLLISAGVLVNPNVVLEEIKFLGCQDRVGVDPGGAAIEPKHIEADKGSQFLSKTIGTTGTGTGPCNADRVQRIAKRVGDIPELQLYLTDVAKEVNAAIGAGKNVILEGSQGTLLSLYHGTYPYCTSKDVTASSICADVGIGPRKVTDVLIVFKAYVTRVGGGDLPGELPQDELIRRGWAEIATVTGRVRRGAPFNFELAKRTVMLNGATQVAITKMDAVFPECKGIRSESQLSPAASLFVRNVEFELGVPVCFLGTGPEAEDIIDRRGKT